MSCIYMHIPCFGVCIIFLYYSFPIVSHGFPPYFVATQQNIACSQIGVVGAVGDGVADAVRKLRVLWFFPREN